MKLTFQGKGACTTYFLDRKGADAAAQQRL